mgnify:CR=1 FL=1
MEINEIKDWLDQKEAKLEELKKLVDLDVLKASITAVEEKTYASDFWDDHTTAQKVISELKIKKHTYDSMQELIENLENMHLTIELLELGETVDTLQHDMQLIEKNIDSIETKLLLSEEYDTFNAIIEIHPGAGGTESQDWAEMLLRMYRRYAEDKNFKIETNDYQAGTEAGIKSVTFTVSGDFAFGMLKAESGVHRLVRISPFDASGRRHTSFASVNIIPEIDDTVTVDMDEKELKIDTYRSSGAGGQSVNTTDSAVRITHLPTKLTVTCQNERSQIKNREKAMQILKGKLYQLELEKQKETIGALKNTTSANAFGSQIRSYVMHPYSMVKDHRTDIETGNVSKVMDGDLDPFITAYLKQAFKEEL